MVFKEEGLREEREKGGAKGDKIENKGGVE